MSVLARVIAASEALEVGDVELARTILHDLETDLSACGGVVLRFACRKCGRRFQWPGEREDHERFSHWEQAA
jgi:hypothetical protein